MSNILYFYQLNQRFTPPLRFDFYPIIKFISTVFKGLPVVLVESIVSGTPIIAMDCPTGPRDIIGNKNEYGKLIPLHHQDKFIQATLELLENEDLYQNYVQQSLIRAKDFSLEHISQKVQCLFEKIKK